MPAGARNGSPQHARGKPLGPEPALLSIGVADAKGLQMHANIKLDIAFCGDAAFASRR